MMRLLISLMIILSAMTAFSAQPAGKGGGKKDPVLPTFLGSTNVLPECSTSTNVSITLAWEYDFLMNPTVNRFHVYWGTESRAYSNSLTTATTNGTVSNLVNGATYYFAATALDNTSESDYSNELSYRVPDSIKRNFTLQIQMLTNNIPRLYTQVCPSQTVIFEWTADFSSWKLLASVVADQYGNVVYDDIDATRGRYRFYRAYTPQ